MKIFKKKKESEFFMAIKALIEEANQQPKESNLKIVHVKQINSK
jgi:hypothetical protein